MPSLDVDASPKTGTIGKNICMLSPQTLTRSVSEPQTGVFGLEFLEAFDLTYFEAAEVLSPTIVGWRRQRCCLEKDARRPGEACRQSLLACIASLVCWSTCMLITQHQDGPLQGGRVKARRPPVSSAHCPLHKVWRSRLILAQSHKMVADDGNARNLMKDSQGKLAPREGKTHWDGPMASSSTRKDALNSRARVVSSFKRAGAHEALRCVWQVQWFGCHS